MVSVEIIVGWLTLMALVLLGAILVTYEWARANDPQPYHRVSLRARYRRGRHHATPPLAARLIAAYLTGASEMAATYTLLRGASL